MKYSCLFLILTFGCTNSDKKMQDLKFQKFTMASLEEKAVVINQMNHELSQLVEESQYLRNMVQNMIDTIFQLEEHIIASTGGYRQGFNGSRFYTVTTEVTNSAELIRNNPYGVTKTYLNRVPKFLKNKGFDVKLTAMNPSDDPYYKQKTLTNPDYFDTAFGNKNLIQIIITFHEIKLHLLTLERKYLQNQLEACNVK